MTPEEFLVVIDSLVPTIKKRAQTRDKSKMPEFYPGYNKFVYDYERAKVQANGEFPERLFASIAPLQTKDELEYIRANYESETQDVFIEFSNTVKKAVTNGVIEFSALKDKETVNKLKDYLSNQINDFDQFTDWMDAMVDHKLIDANGIVCVWPEDVETDADGVVIGKIYPQPIIYAVPSVLWKKDGEFIVLTSKKSEVTTYGKPKREGLVFRYIGRESYMEAIQYGAKTDDTFKVDFEFAHGITDVDSKPFVPATYLKGKTIIHEDTVYYESTFDSAVGFLNLATLHASNDLIILRKVGYPTRVVTRSKCQHSENGSACMGGIISITDGEKRESKTCPSCHGLGYTNVFGPMSELTISEPDNSTDQKSNTTALNAMAYVAPSVEIPKHLEELVAEKISRAKEVLHLRSQPRGSGDISATEKNRDKENTEAFIRPISDQIWSIAELIIESMGRLIAPEQYEENKPNIIRPTTFDLVSAEDYVTAISEARKSDLPEVIIQDMVYRYMAKVHKNSSLSMQIYELIESSDRLIAVDSADVAIGLSRGTIQKWESILHQSVFYIIDKLIREDDSFLADDMDVQIEKIQTAAKGMVVETTGAFPPAIEP